MLCPELNHKPPWALSSPPPLRTCGLGVRRAGLPHTLLLLVLELNTLAEYHEHLQREGVEGQGENETLHFLQALLGGLLKAFFFSDCPPSSEIFRCAQPYVLFFIRSNSVCLDISPITLRREGGDKKGDWRDVSVVRSKHCSYGGPEFSPQHPTHSCL